MFDLKEFYCMTSVHRCSRLQLIRASVRSSVWLNYVQKNLKIRSVWICVQSYYYLMHAKLPNRTVHLNESIKAHFIVRLCLSRPFLYQWQNVLGKLNTLTETNLCITLQSRARDVFYITISVFIHYNNKTELKRSKQTEKDDGNEEEEVEVKLKRISNETEMRELDVI